MPEPAILIKNTMPDLANTEAATAASQDTPHKPHIPGELGIWLFVAGDLIVFAVFFILIAQGHREHAELFEQSRAKLDVWIGAFNTLLLLTASWFVASGVDRRRRNLAAAYHFPAAIACGLGFIGNKIFEWHGKISLGLTLETNDFFMYFFVFTGIHLLHVLVGLAVLCVMTAIARNRALSTSQIRSLESGATFWHLVDLLWVVLFALLYLL